MSVNSNDVFKVARRERLKNERLLVECNVNIDSEQPITKVLSVEVSCEQNMVECLTKEATVSGTLFLNVVYMCEDSSIASGTYKTTFDTKFNSDFITPNCTVYSSSDVSESKVVSINGETVKVLCSVDTVCELFDNDDVKFLNQVDENVCTKYQEQDYFEFAGKVSSSWLESVECEVKEQIRCVLSSSTVVILKKITPENNFVSLEGQLISKFVYLTDEENPVTKTVYCENDFKQELENDIISSESIAVGYVEVLNSQIKTTIDEKDGKVKIVEEIPLAANVLVFNKKTTALISDLYSTTNLINVTNSSYNNIVPQGFETFEKKIDGSLTLTDNEPRIDKLLALSVCKANVINSYLNNGMLVVEGVVNANVIYLNDESSMVHSVDIEFPFVVSNQTDFPENSQIDAYVIVSESDAVVKKGREIFVDAKICVFANAYQETVGAVISDLKQSEVLMPRDYAMEIYFAKAGDDCWSIGKELKIDSSVIEFQNPDLVFPLEKDENITIYYQKTK